MLVQEPLSEGLFGSVPTSTTDSVSLPVTYAYLPSGETATADAPAM
jgi:hypothetical protein